MINFYNHNEKEGRGGGRKEENIQITHYDLSQCLS